MVQVYPTPIFLIFLKTQNPLNWVLKH